MNRNEIKKRLKQRFEMGQALKGVCNFIAIDTRLLTIWKGENDGLLQVRIKDIDENKFELAYSHLDIICKGEFKLKDLDDVLEGVAELIEADVQEWNEFFPADELRWDWLGD